MRVGKAKEVRKAVAAPSEEWRRRGGRAARGVGADEPSRMVGELSEPITSPLADRLLIATLKLRTPKGLWTTLFSNANPNVRLEVLNQSIVDPAVSVSDYWISGRPPGVWSREIGACADVLKVDALTELGEGSLYRVTYRNPPVVYLFRGLGIPLQFPMRIQAGTIQIEVVARYPEFQKVLDYARKSDPAVRVVSIRRRSLRSHLPNLSENQQDLLARAMAEGYFAVPRKITLTDLAKKVNRSKSSVSEAIALIEQKLLETALGPSALVP